MTTRALVRPIGLDRVEVGGSNPPGSTPQRPINTNFLLAEHSSCALAHEERQLANVGAETFVTSA